MSSSRYSETTTTTAPGMPRSYNSQENTQFRGTNPNTNTSNYRDTDYDETRHHGRWTASGESRDLNDRSGRDHSNRDRDHSNRDRDHDRDHDRSSRDFNRDQDRDYDRSNRHGYNSGFDSSYGSHPSAFGGQSGYGSHPSAFGGQSGYGSHPSAFGGQSGYGSHPSYGSHSSYGMPYDQSQSSFPSSFPHYGMGSAFPHGSNYGMADRSLPQHHGSSYGSHSSMALPPYGHNSGMMGGMGSGMGSGMMGGMGSGMMGGMGSGMGSRSLSRSSYGNPEVDIYEVGNDYIIELDLPGHSRDHIDTKLYGNELVISSKPPRRSHNFHINERSLGSNDVSRRLYLPQDAHTGNINASLTNGVLKIIIPRNATTGATGTTGTTGLSSASTPIVLTTVPSTGSSSVHPTTLIKDTTTTTTETKRI